jgi:hypothetical protein
MNNQTVLNAADEQALHQWLRGEIERPAPTDSWTVHQFRNLLTNHIPDVSRHFFKDVCRHHELVQSMFELWKLVSSAGTSQKNALEYILEDILEGCCKHHDLSKFTPADSEKYLVIIINLCMMYLREV